MKCAMSWCGPLLTCSRPKYWLRLVLDFFRHFFSFIPVNVKKYADILCLSVLLSTINYKCKICAVRRAANPYIRRGEIAIDKTSWLKICKFSSRWQKEARKLYQLHAR
jgi:hypothetical protein